MMKKWLNENLFEHKFYSENIFEISNLGKFYNLPERDVMIDERLILQLEDEEHELLKTEKIDFISYKFGDNYYYSPTVKIKEFDILKYVGKSIFEDEQYPFIGIHGEFEILNGSRSYKDWVQKAKFMNMSVLGICEKNTLAGSLKFQLACKSKGIRPIIGAQYTVKDNEDYFTIRFYVINEEGWKSILLINTEVNVVNNKFVELDKLIEFANGLFIIIEPKTTDFEKGSKVYRKFKSHKERVFFQFDDTVYESDETDERFLTNVKRYLDSEIKPIFIPDAYYLDKDEYRAKDLLNTISDKRDFKSHNQYLKSIESAMLSISGLFDSEEKYVDVCTEALSNLMTVSEMCTFNIAVGQRLLPNYTMTKEEKKLYANNEEMFMSLIEIGIQNKLSHLSDVELKKYIDRVDLEWGVIVGNGYADYFLILWDIIRWARANDILVGIGRGSAGGSLIAYLTDIIQIDPLEFDLLFERFLNDGRAKVSYPDIDTDFEASRRDDVKRYLEERYGWENVCSVGTYTNLQLKQTLKDVSKIHGVSYEAVNYISEIFNLEDDKWSSLFIKAVEKSPVKDFIKNYPEIIEDMRLIQGQPKSSSIHACATIITPNSRSVFESFPVRAEMKGDEIVIISEWEGSDLESAGYLKEDILGIKQLDKYRFILNLIKETTGDVVDIYRIPYDDRDVIELFQRGMNGDVFHLGSPGLTAYCVLMHPENINDLIAAIALFRPGAMGVNSHNEYVLRKHGERSVEYKFMMEPITKETYGLIVYQEQVMKVFQVLADFTLTEADDIRRAIGKKRRDLIDSKKKIFVEKVISKGGQLQEAEEIWHEVEVHAGYSFNKSHAAAYAITGYIGQWLKLHYPIQFWTAAFEFDDPSPKKSKINKYISEINKSSNSIKINSPDINQSTPTFAFNFEEQCIYWSISKVRGVGEKVIEEILSERDKNGPFFSIEEFLDRVDRRVVNKTVVTNLILSGCFDIIEDVKRIEDREYILNKFYKVRGIKEADRIDMPVRKFNWEMKQKEMCGYGTLDYKYIIMNFTEFSTNDFVSGFDLQNGEYVNKLILIGGIITSITTRSTKKAGDYAVLELESNHDRIYVTLWNDSFETVKDRLETGKILMMEGVCINDTYRNEFAIHSSRDSTFIII
jgi:DNA polymerase-3 subunit alpha